MLIHVYLLLWCFNIFNACVYIFMMLFYVLKWCFLFGVNVYVFIPIMFFIVENVKIGFLFSVNTCVFIPMMLFHI